MQMIGRSLWVWCSFSLFLWLVAVTTQAGELDLGCLGWALFFALPVAIATQLGGLGSDARARLQYPSAAWLVVVAWVLGVAPSLIVDPPEAHLVFRFSEAALMAARALFMLWCTLFVIVAGRPAETRLRAELRTPDLLALSATGVACFIYLARVGLFSFYQPVALKQAVEPGGFAASVVVAGIPLFTILPPIFLLAVTRARTRTLSLATWAAFAGSWIGVFFLASRTSIAVALAACLLLARRLQFTLRPVVVLGVAALLPTVLVLMMAYRNALVSSNEGALSFGQYMSVATDATSSLENQEQRASLLHDISSNVRVRLWYGQQFCVVVDNWLEQGAELRGSFLSGLAGSLPSLFFPDKNAVSASYDLEYLLQSIGLFPVGDLGPMPWMQWLFELGIAGIFCGALFYGWLVRILERRIGAASSVYELVFWLELFIVIWTPEHTTDGLLMSARNTLVVIALVGPCALVLSKLGASVQLQRRERGARAVQ